MLSSATIFTWSHQLFPSNKSFSGVWVVAADANEKVRKKTPAPRKRSVLFMGLLSLYSYVLLCCEIFLQPSNELFRAAEFHKFASGIQAEFSRLRRRNLQRYRAFHLSVFLRSRSKQFVGRQIQHHKFSAFDESRAIRSGL